MKPANMQITRQLIGYSAMETVFLIEDLSFRSVLEIPLGMLFFFLVVLNLQSAFFQQVDVKTQNK